MSQGGSVGGVVTSTQVVAEEEAEEEATEVVTVVTAMLTTMDVQVVTTEEVAVAWNAVLMKVAMEVVISRA